MHGQNFDRTKFCSTLPMTQIRGVPSQVAPGTHTTPASTSTGVMGAGRWLFCRAARAAQRGECSSARQLPVHYSYRGQRDDDVPARPPARLTGVEGDRKPADEAGAAAEPVGLRHIRCARRSVHRHRMCRGGVACVARLSARRLREAITDHSGWG